jgi:hypothetical protein
MAVTNDGTQISTADGKVVPLDDVVAVIDADELQAARSDPQWQSFYQEAVDYRAQMMQAGRSS